MMQEIYSTNDYRNYLQHAQWKWPGGKNSSEYNKWYYENVTKVKNGAQNLAKDVAEDWNNRGNKVIVIDEDTVQMPDGTYRGREWYEAHKDDYDKPKEEKEQETDTEPAIVIKNGGSDDNWHYDDKGIARSNDDEYRHQQARKAYAEKEKRKRTRSKQANTIGKTVLLADRYITHSEYSANDFRMYQENYLCHHGRLGQRKGVKNGPPYPLGEDQLTSVYEKNGGMSESAKEVYGEGGSSGSEKKPEKKSLLRKMKEHKVKRELELEEMRRQEQEKIRNQEEENRKQLQREAEEKFEQAKKSAIDKGDKKWVKANFDKLTNQELEVALNRINYRQRVDTAYEEKVKTGWDRMDSVMKHVGQMTEWARKGTNAYNTGVKIYNAFHPEDPMPYIFDPQQQPQKKQDKDKGKGDKNGGNGGNGNKS